MNTREIYDTFKYTKACTEACEYQGRSSDPCIEGELAMLSCCFQSCGGMFGLCIDGTRYLVKKTQDCCTQFPEQEGPKQQLMP